MTEQHVSTDGAWWLPDAPGSKVRGTLSEAAGAFELVLEGELTTLEERFDTGLHLILGETYTGAHSTLLGARRSSSSVTLRPGGRFPSGRYLAPLLLEGQALDNPFDVPVRATAFSHTRLFDWLRLSSISLEHPDGFGGGTSAYRLSNPPPLTFTTGNMMVEATVAVDTQGTRAPKRTTLSERHVFRAAFSEPVSLGAVHEICIPELVRFLSFLSGTWIRPEPLQILFADGVGRANSAGKSSATLRYPARLAAFVERDAHFSRVLVDPQAYEARLGTMFSEWLRLTTRAPFLIDLLLSVTFAEGMFLEHRFLSLAQALESFHRWRFGGTHIPEADWIDLKREIQSTVDGRLPANPQRAALNGKLKHLNEISLGERLRSLATYAGGSPLGLVHSVESFVKTVRDTRNYLTHYGDASTHTLDPGEAMAGACDQMRCLLETCILMELGLSLSDVAAAATSNERFGEVRRTIARNPGIS